MTRLKRGGGIARGVRDQGILAIQSFDAFFSSLILNFLARHFCYYSFVFLCGMLNVPKRYCFNSEKMHLNFVVASAV